MSKGSHYSNVLIDDIAKVEYPERVAVLAEQFQERA